MIGLFIIAWQTVSRQRLRSLLTAISLILGVMALTSVAAAEQVMRQTITRTALLNGGPTVTCSVAITTSTAPDEAAEHWAAILEARFGASTRTARVVFSNQLGILANGKPVPDVQVNLVDPRLIQIKPFDILDGVWLSDTPNTLAPNLVLNQAAANQFPSESGWVLWWGQEGASTTAVRIGTVDDGQMIPVIYLDLGQSGAWRDTALLGGNVSLLIHADDVGLETVTTTVRQIAGIAGLSGQIGDIQRTDTVDQLGSELNTAARVFLTITAIALIIAALGMLNIGLSTVTERSDELALRRTFGAHRRDIITIMLLESELVALTAGFIGVVLSYVAMPLTLRLFGASSVSATFPLTAALIGCIAGCGAAFIGALTPAIRAAHIPIASIMRE